MSANTGYSNPTSKAYDDGTNGAGTARSGVDSTAILGVAIGMEITPAIKIELEYSRAGYKTDSARTIGSGARALDTFGIDFDLDVDLLTLNTSYDFINESKFTPFVKGGLGKAFYDMEGDFYVGSNGGNTFGGVLPASFNYEGSGSEFAYFLGAGVDYEISDNAELTFEYRYTDLGKIATDYDAAGDRIQSDLKTNNIQIGFRYYFQ